MSGYVVVGTQWGDEGKGKVVDLLGTHVDMVVRFQGGNNAGHTVVVNGQKTILHLLPSGILNTESVCVIGPGVVVNPTVLLKEMNQLKEQGLTCDHLKISDRAHLLMPYHVRLDELIEARGGKYKIGTTKNGIGPCYADKYSRVGLRVCDLVDWDVFEEKLRSVLPVKNDEITKVYGGEPFDLEEMITAVDVSATALEEGRANAKLNHLDNVEFVQADVFDYLDTLQQGQYDVIVLDPPAFTKSRKTVMKAYNGYKRINQQAMHVLRHGGYLITCSCSRYMETDLFEKMLVEAAQETGVRLRQVSVTQQNGDHPILWTMNETSYLKFYIFQVW